MPDSESKSGILPQRLCSEIQLFDLCDLDACRYKNARFCSNPGLLARFEKIAEEELRTPERYVSDETDDDDEASYGDDEGYYEDEGSASDISEDGENDGWED